MNKFCFYFFLFLLLSGFLSACSGGKVGTPRPSQENPSLAEGFDSETKLYLIGKFQVRSSDGEKIFYETSLPVQWVPRDPDLPARGKEIHVFPKEGFQLSNLTPGDYLFRVLLFHKSENQGNILVASIETNASVKKGQNSPLDFSKSIWNYQFDDDQDGFSNIAELANDYQEEEQGPTDPKDKESYPHGPYLVAPDKITPTSPDDQKNSKVVGDLQSVQSGTIFTLIHFGSDGKTIKEKINFSSRIDGSFEVNLKESEEEDQLLLIVGSKMQGDVVPAEAGTPRVHPGDPRLRGDDTPFSQWLKITHHPLKMLHCRSVPRTDPEAGSGYVLLEGEGISKNIAENEVFFPTGDRRNPYYPAFGDISISWEGPKSRELKVEIPPQAISGYPRVHVTSPKDSWGECPTDQPVVVMQNKAGDPLPDLYIPRIDPPYVALLGQRISIDIPIVNQGMKEISSNTQFFYSTQLTKGATEREIYPNSIPLDNGGAIETINGLKKGSFIFPPQSKYFLIPSIPDDSFRGSVLFKGRVGFQRGVENEQDITNNNRVADHETFIHYLDLKIQLLQDGGQDGIYFNGSFLPIVDKKDLNKNYLEANVAQPISLKNGGTFPISLGTVSNNGTFPLIRDKSVSPFQYLSSDPNDPLDTNKTVYQNAMELYAKKDYADGEPDFKKSSDLKKLSAAKLIEEANLLNQKTELPILVHAYFSADDKFISNALFASEKEVDVPILCDDRLCELCIDRLERQKSVGRGQDGGPNENETSIFLWLPLGGKSILPRTGYLFIVAEAIQVDPRKVDKNKRVDYCTASDEERKKMHLKYSGNKDNGAIPLIDYAQKDNLIMIPIQ